MKVERGKEYITRGGQRARIYATEHTYYDEIHGAIEIMPGKWAACTWYESGRVSYDERQSRQDLVREWPKETKETKETKGTKDALPSWWTP